LDRRRHLRLIIFSPDSPPAFLGVPGDQRSRCFVFQVISSARHRAFMRAPLCRGLVPSETLWEGLLRSLLTSPLNPYSRTSVSAILAGVIGFRQETASLFGASLISFPPRPGLSGSLTTASDLAVSFLPATLLLHTDCRQPFSLPRLFSWRCFFTLNRLKTSLPWGPPAPLPFLFGLSTRLLPRACVFANWDWSSRKTTPPL